MTFSSLFVDPGIRGCGAALFDGKTLRAATWVRNPVEKGGGPTAWDGVADAVISWALRDQWAFAWAPVEIDLIGVEVMQIRRAGGRAGRQSDLVDLVGVAGAIRIPGVPRVGYAPEEWKGNMDGQKFIDERIKPRLTADEAARVVLPSRKAEWDDVYDAIGIGLKYHGRLEPYRVIAR
jgi:hypothetical protein